jgi:hypothetical protein
MQFGDVAPLPSIVQPGHSEQLLMKKLSVLLLRVIEWAPVGEAAAEGDSARAALCARTKAELHLL